MTNKNIPLGSLVQRFFLERLIAQQNASPNTVISYRDTWRLLLQYLINEKKFSIQELTIHDLTAETILEFLGSLENQRGSGIRSRNQRLAAIKSFYKFAVFADPSVLNTAQRVLMLPNKRYEHEVLGFLTREEMDCILQVPDRRTMSGRKTYALLQFIYNTGTRVSEAIAVKITDLKLEPPCAQVLIHGKGNKQRIVPLWKETGQILEELLSETTQKEVLDNFVFRNARGFPITRSGVAYLLHSTVQEASKQCPSLQNRKITPHTLRHTTAAHMLQSGVDINLIRMWLGHVKLDTTHLYAECDLKMKRMALAKGGLIPATQTPDWTPTDEILSFLDDLS